MKREYKGNQISEDLRKWDHALNMVEFCRRIKWMTPMQNLTAKIFKSSDLNLT